MKKLKGIILGVLLAASVLMPFNIYADTRITTSNITGCHITDKWLSDGTAYNSITCDMDDDYYGYATMTIQYYVGSSSSPTSQAYYVTVSGNSFDAVLITSNQSINSQKPITVISVYDNYIYKVEDVSDVLMWDIPFESFGFVASCFNYNLENVGFNELNNYKYPIFKINSNDTLIQFWGSTDDQFQKYRMILFIDRNIYNTSILSNYFELSDGEFTSMKLLNRFRYNGRVSYVLDITIGNFTSGGNKTIYYKYSDSSEIIPIYFDYYDYNLVSLEFALQFGLTNSFIEDVHTIAQGTSGSQSSASDLEDNNDQMSDDMNDLATIENGYNQNFNDQLENIDFTNPIQSNQGILPAANFVISVFNGLINNNPFSLLIIVCCILLIGKKVIGK